MSVSQWFHYVCIQSPTFFTWQGSPQFSTICFAGSSLITSLPTSAWSFWSLLLLIYTFNSLFHVFKYIQHSDFILCDHFNIWYLCWSGSMVCYFTITHSTLFTYTFSDFLKKFLFDSGSLSFSLKKFFEAWFKKHPSRENVSLHLPYISGTVNPGLLWTKFLAEIYQIMWAVCM